MARLVFVALGLSFGLGPSLGLTGCADDPAYHPWPALEHDTTWYLAYRRSEGPELRYVQSDRPLTLEAESLEGALLLGYQCSDPAALGLELLGGVLGSWPTEPLRAPERLMRFTEAGGAPTWQFVTVEPAAFEWLPAELRLPSDCRRFEPASSSRALAAGLQFRFLITLPDGTALLSAQPIDAGSPRRLVQIMGPHELVEHEVAEDTPLDAATIDTTGRLWLYGENGRLMRGDPRDLPELASRFELLSEGPGSLPCEAGTGRNDVKLAVWVQSATIAEALVIDGSGKLQHFDGTRWSTLSDRASEPGGESLRCRVGAVDVTWVGRDEAIGLSRALGPWPIVNLRRGADGAWSLGDDLYPPSGKVTNRLLDLGTRGVLAASAPQGEMMQRVEGVWRMIDERQVLSVGDFTITEGPQGSIVFGSRDDGIRQHWLGSGTCLEGIDGYRLSQVTRLQDDLLASVSILSTFTVGALEVWRMRAPGVCEAHAR